MQLFQPKIRIKYQIGKLFVDVIVWLFIFFFSINKGIFLSRHHIFVNIINFLFINK